jgi:hypothetical protein
MRTITIKKEETQHKHNQYNDASRNDADYKETQLNDTQ